MNLETGDVIELDGMHYTIAVVTETKYIIVPFIRFLSPITIYKGAVHYKLKYNTL